MADEEIDDVNENEEIENEEEELPEEASKDEDEGASDEGAAGQPKHRANDRIRNLLEENRRLQERSDDFTRQLTELKTRFDQQNNYASQMSEQERLASMSYEERIQYDLQKTIERQNAFEQQQRQFQIDNRDKLQFQSLVQSLPPEVQKLAPQVENELNAIRQQLGQNFPRQVVLATLLGMQAIAAAQNGSVAQAKTAAKRKVQSQTTTPRSGASDVQRRDRNQKSPRERLEGLVF